MKNMILERYARLDPCKPNPGQTVASPNCSNESEILVTLPPGLYPANECLLIKLQGRSPGRSI